MRRDDLCEVIKNTINPVKKALHFMFKAVRAFMLGAFVFFIVGIIYTSDITDLFKKDDVKVQQVVSKPNNHTVVKEKSVLTSSEVKHALNAIGEFAAYEQVFSNIDTISNNKTVCGVNVPFTTHTIEYSYSGVVKAGYKVSDIHVDVNVTENAIIVYLPECRILDSYIDQDSIKCVQNNNIFNPIESDELSEALNEACKKEVERAINEDIFILANDNARGLINNLLSCFVREGYEIVYR